MISINYPNYDWDELYFTKIVIITSFILNNCFNTIIVEPDAVDGPSGPSGPVVQGPGQAPDQDLGAPGARCPSEFGTYRSNQNCGVFYLCVGYQPFEFVCPGGLNFHKVFNCLELSVRPWDTPIPWYSIYC